MCPSSRGLVVFDLDGTLLRGLTVCEILAAPLGRLHATQSFEVLTSEAEIAKARIEMARWYAGVPRARLLEPLGAAAWAPGTCEGVARLLVEGVEVAIASITWQFAVEWFARQLGVSRFLGTGLSPSGAVHHVWPRDKAVWLE
jgi:phosphoserine phosphatase